MATLYLETLIEQSITMLVDLALKAGFKGLRIAIARLGCQI